MNERTAESVTDPLQELEDEELRQIFELSTSPSDRVKSLLDGEWEDAQIDDLSALSVVRDEAYGTYWRRRIANHETIGSGILGDLLSFDQFPTARSIAGELILSGRIDLPSCQEVLRRYGTEEWVGKQARANILLAGISSRSSQEPGRQIWPQIDEMIALRAAWAILRSLDHLENEELLTLIDKMKEAPALSRRDRHEIKERAMLSLKSRN